MKQKDSRKQYDVYVDLQILNDEELDMHISSLKLDCAHGPNTLYSGTILSSLLMIATAEKNSRSAAKEVAATNQLALETLKLTRTTIRLWWTAIIIAAVSVIIGVAGLLVGIFL